MSAFIADGDAKRMPLGKGKGRTLAENEGEKLWHI